MHVVQRPSARFTLLFPIQYIMSYAVLYIRSTHNLVRNLEFKLLERFVRPKAEQDGITIRPKTE